MLAKLFNKKIVFVTITVLLMFLLNVSIFYRIYNLNTLTFEFIETDITVPSWLWKPIKALYFLFVITSWIFISSATQRFFIIQSENNLPPSINVNNNIDLFVGNSIDFNQPVTIPEKGLYQNILITGTIGTGKTSSAMYPFVDQLLKYDIGMLILDVKGNFHSKVQELSKKYNKRVTVIELGGKYKYNPLDKPNLKPSILANRLKTILTLFSNQHSTDSYWLDKVELYLTECIKLCRLYNNNYVTFIELHKLINAPPYLEEKIQHVKGMFLANKLTTNQVYDFKTCIEFFTTEFKNLDSKVLSIIQSEITRITQIFTNDYEVASTFCPQKCDISFLGFNNLENNIVVLNMNVAEYRNLAKIIAAYLKLDFQSEVLMRLASLNKINPVAFVCDEYSEYATSNDADFFSQSREAKCINIISTQSYTSLLNALKEQSTAKVIIQSLVNKIWFRTDDIFTIEEAQKQLGKEDKVKISRSLSENAKETKFNYLLNTFKSDASNLSESVSTSIQHDYVYDINVFSRELQTFQAICFISDGMKILPTQKVQLSPIQEQNKFI